MNGNWSFDTEEALRLWEQGLSDQQIGEQLGVPDSYIGRWRRRHGLVMQKKVACFDEALARAMWEEGACDPEIAKVVHVTQETIRAWRGRNGMKGNHYTRRSSSVAGYHHDTEHMVRKDNPMAPGYVDKLVDRSCHKCRFWCKNTNTCDYLLVTDRRRPCHPGKGCTVREKEVHTDSGKRIRWDAKKARELYMAGMNDTAIGRELGVSAYTISCWRQREKLPSNCPRREYKKDWDKEEALRLYKKGMGDKAIGELVGVGGSVIWKWRQREGLKPNGK